MNDISKEILIKTDSAIIILTIYGNKDNLFYVPDADVYGEAAYQIKEGCTYEYKISDGYCLRESDIIKRSKVNQSSGWISPNIYVGTITIDILEAKTCKKCEELRIEVQSVKTTYREDYRYMLEDITEKCTELLLRHNSPVTQNFTINFNSDAKTLYQRFAFIKSILDSNEFDDSVHKILTSPVTRWEEEESLKDIRGIKRINNSVLRQIGSINNRIELPENHPLKKTAKSIPARIKINFKTETADTPENRFIKYALISFRNFCNDFRLRLKDNSRLTEEASFLENKLEQYLSHAVFKDIPPPITLPLNSPILQRKEGYREIFRVWLMFDLAARLIWRGGDDIYEGNKRDVAVLYEYWLFFKLLDIIKSVFNVKSLATKELIEETKDGLGLRLKQGKYLPIRDKYINNIRNLNIEFSYNRTFTGNKKYPEGGSWTRDLRPDYTISIWPEETDQKLAEEEELIVHIHFDSKYKIEELKDLYGKTGITNQEETENELNEEKEEEKKGTYKRADILKMHTYRDAIRRTAGAYVLYPGSKSEIKTGFHEILPGLGAFAISPSKTNDGAEVLIKFLKDISHHFLNRASQREKLSYKTFETFRKKSSDEINDAIPEAYGDNRDLLPDETYVLVAYYKDKTHLDWIENNGLYNARSGNGRGALKLGTKEAGAKFLLLHNESEPVSDKLYKMTETGPQIITRQEIIEMHYPTIPTQEFYLLYSIKKSNYKEFTGVRWDYKRLQGYNNGINSALPFVVNLTELMKVVIKE